MKKGPSLDALFDAAERHLEAGDEAAALSAIEQARDLALAGAPNDPRIAQSLRAAGVLLMRLGRYDEAQTQLEAAAERYDTEDPRRAVLLGDLANLAFARGDAPSAEAHLEEAIRTIDENTDDVGVAVVPLLGLLAAVRAQSVDRLDEARPLAARALDILITEEGDASVHVADTLLFCALLDLRSSRPRDAKALAAQTLRIYERGAAAPERLAAAAYVVAEGWHAMGNTEEADAALERARAWSPDATSLEAELQRMRGAIARR